MRLYGGSPKALVGDNNKAVSVHMAIRHALFTSRIIRYPEQMPKLLPAYPPVRSIHPVCPLIWLSEKEAGADS